MNARQTSEQLSNKQKREPRKPTDADKDTENEMFHAYEHLKLHINAERLGNNVDLDDSPYIQFLPELVANPGEVWLLWERNTSTGQVRLTMRLIARFLIEEQEVYLVLEAEPVGADMMEARDYYATTDKEYVETLRVGQLINWKGNKTVGPD